jgi:hypothetical protein
MRKRRTTDRMNESLDGRGTNHGKDLLSANVYYLIHFGGNLISARATDLQDRYASVSIKWPKINSVECSCMYVVVSNSVTSNYY